MQKYLHPTNVAMFDLRILRSPLKTGYRNGGGQNSLTFESVIFYTVHTLRIRYYRKFFDERQTGNVCTTETNTGK